MRKLALLLVLVITPACSSGSAAPAGGSAGAPTGSGGASAAGTAGAPITGGRINGWGAAAATTGTETTGGIPAAAGGAQGAGGASATGGTAAATGAQAPGGTGGTGGTTTAAGTGAIGDTNGAGGTTTATGAGATGGTNGAEGTTAVVGAGATGGTSGAGGTTAVAGAGGTGGTSGAGGTTAVAGAGATGGTSGAGGTTAVAGAGATGGTSGAGGTTTAAGAGGTGGTSETGGTAGFAGAKATPWVGTWATGPQLTEEHNLPPAPGLSGNTLRQVVHVSIGGEQLRLKFSNEFGTSPVTMNSVHLAVSEGGSAIDLSADEPLTFDGSPAVTISAGQAVISDPLDYDLAPLSSQAVTIHFGTMSNDIVTGHPGSRTTSYLQMGDAVAAAEMSTAATTDHWYILSGIDVAAASPSAAIVVLGDSISDGRGSTTNGNNRWPDNLARRLQENPNTASVAVLNQGIGGNAVLAGGLGPTALDRFDRDVLGQSGVRWLIVLEGVNDIGNSSPQAAAGVATGLIAAYGEFIDQAHEHDILVYGVPILPFAGSQYAGEEREAARRTVNEWIRTGGEFDAVIDLDAAVRDPTNPESLLAAYDDGDHLHLSVAGYQAMADAIDLELFTQ